MNFPLSFAQQRLWFIDQLVPNSALYNIPLSMPLKGEIDRNTLQIALNKLIERHEVLRTVFKAIEGTPYQVIQEHLELDLPLIDISLLKEKEKTAKVKECIEKDPLIPFNLTEGPLIRTSLIKIEEQQHIFLLTIHHIVTDGWSFGVIYEDLSELYNATLEKREAHLPSLPVQYIDFSVWQREYLKEEGETYKKLLSYWAGELGGAPALLALPTDHPRPPTQSYKGNHRSLSLSSDLTKKLKELSEETQTTLFMILLAAFYTLLYRYTNQEDMVIGSPIANRNRQEIEHLVGFFVNTLALRVTLSPNLSFREFLSQVKQKTLGAYDHQDLPFEKLVERLGIERSLAHESIFQVMFVLQNAAENAELKLKGLKAEEFFFEHPSSAFDLTLSLIEIGGQLQGSFEYAADLFKPSTIERMQKHFHNLLEEIVNNPNKSLSQLEMLAAEEKQQILVTWNDTQTEYPKDKTIHQLFEEQVTKTPNNIAVIFGNQHLTYQELNTKANQLAHALKERGVKPDTLVAIACDRSLEMIVGILGILKAGGAYVPIDPSYPQERIRFMLEDTKAPLLLAQSFIVEHLPQTQAEILQLDKEKLGNYPTTNPLCLTQSHHLAYVIYTSGSTGQPKGVMIEHKSVGARLAFWQTSYPLKKADVFLQQASISFDASVEEIFWPLSNGLLVVFAYPSKYVQVADLVTLISSYQITFLQCAPSLLKAFLEQPNLKKLSSLRKVFVGGEALHHELKEEFLRKLPNAELKNSYGPTETTIDAMIFPCTASDTSCSNQFVPIGRPISNTQGYILDTFLNLVPVGVIGELYIGGDGLARGYLNQPELTAEKFIKNSFRTEEEKKQGKNARLYKTGDLCRWLEDGHIEYIGRNDDQVKIRGFRIELGEIEAALLQHSQVKDAIVIAREDTPGDKRLVGYLVFKKNEDQDQRIIDISELRTYLQCSLPDYMIPSAFMSLETIPLTTNGKVDRKKGLPAPEHQRDEKTYVAPRTETEKVLCEIWENILKIEKVGIHDNFFTLGGHSLLATQVVSHLRSQYGIEVSLRDFFKNATIEALGQAVEGSPKETREETLPLVVVERTRRIPLSFAQQRLWFIDQLESNSALYNIPAVLKLEGFLEQNVLQSALKNLIERHEVLRTAFKIEEGQPYQAIQEKLDADLPLIDVSLLQGKEKEDKIKECIQEETLAPFSLGEGPLIRAALIKIKEQEHIFLLTLHHSISDEWSFGLIYEELSELYNAALEKQKPDLSSLPVQYADFSVWQREYLKEEGETYKALLNYWVSELQGAPALLALPADHPRPPVQSYKGNYTSFSLSSDLTKKLKELSETAEATLFMTLLAAFYTLLYRYSNQKDLVVGLPIAGRNRQEIEHLVGFFVNTLALRVNLLPDLSFKDLLSQVKQKTLEAYDHQDLPFEKLVEHLRIERSLAHGPLFQVMFDLQNAAENVELQLKGLKVEDVSFEYPIAKFDLSLSLVEVEGQLHGSFEYATDLFKFSTIERMQEHFHKLLEEIVENPNRSLFYLEMLPSEEKQQILLTWNGTEKDYPKDKTIHQLFEEQVAKTPSNIAVVFGDQQLTYQELNIKANQLAHYLRELRVGPEQLVAICLEKSLDTVVSLLAVWKAGGAYVPLDPDYPKERLEFMLENTQPPVLLTLSHLKDMFPNYSGQLVCLDLFSTEGWSNSNPLPISLPSHLAYVIYTSGSTGTPKGVMVEHTSLCKAHYSWCEAYHLENLSSYLQMASFSFDVFVGDIIRALYAGVKLVLCPRSILLDPISLYQLLKKEKIECAEFVPAVLRSLIEHMTQLNVTLENFKVLIVGSDQWSVEEYQQLRDFLPSSARLLNSFGVTEATIDSTFFETPQSLTGTHFNLLPIGRPFSNTKIYILDKYGQLVPIGISGELYIGGDGLARGYLNRPELTAERFIENPFQTKEEKIQGKNGRLYKTGDLCRWLEDGNIEYIGRMDDQVKIRGFRIELGEIEAALLQHVQIKAAVVIVREDTPGDKRLVGYLVFKDKDQEIVEVSELRAHLSAILPNYMIPSAFVVFEAIPLTTNGKVDRKGLPAPEYQGDEKSYVAPRTETEKTLCEIWQSVLNIGKVGIHDNFFALGGHSLLATQVVSRLRSQYGIEVSLRDFFKNSTIEALGRAVESSPKETREEALPLVVVERAGRIPLSFAQQRLWFIDQLESNSALYNIPVALKLEGSLDQGALQSGLNKLIERHEVLRTVFKTEEGKPYQVIQEHLESHLFFIDVSLLKGKEKEDKVKECMQEEALAPFSLADGPLIRAALIKFKEQEHIFLLTFHHSISDEWSFGTIYEELSELYNTAVEKKGPQLASLPVQYADFSVWQREYLKEEGETYKKLISYWVNELKGAPTLLELPTDHPRPPAQSYRGNFTSFFLPPDLTKKLKELSEETQTTLFMTVLASFYALLYRYTNQEDMVVGLPIAGRNRQEIEYLVGFFVNMLPLRIKFSMDLSFRDLLSQVKQKTLGAYDHQDLPFEKLVEHLKVERSLSHEPLFQVMFDLQNASENMELKLKGLKVEEVSFEYPIAKFDLSLSLIEIEGQLQGSFEYATDLFKPATIERMQKHFHNL